MAATNITREVLQKRSEGIKKAKSSPDHRKKMSDITTELWKTPEFRAKHENRIPWNKLPQHSKVEKICPQCGDVFYVVPSHGNRKCCSKICADNFKTGKVHVNWNPDSMKHSGYKFAIRGWYKGTHHFRSSYELSFMVMMDGKTDIVVEPFFVWYEYEGKRRRYYPDFLVGGNVVVEVKPKCFVGDTQNVLKQQALTEYCNAHGMSCEVWTEDDITLLSKDDITKMIVSGIVDIKE